MEGVTTVFKGDTGFNGLSILVGFVVFRVHDVDIVVHAPTVGTEYGLEQVVVLCSNDDPLYPVSHSTVLSSTASMQVAGSATQ